MNLPKGRAGFFRGRSSESTWIRLLLSPAGALLTMICFFLPWGRFSCVGMTRCRSGAQLGGSIWLVFAAVSILLAAGGVLLLLRRWKQARVVMLVCSLSGLAVLGLRATRIVFGFWTPVGAVRPQQIGVVPQWGGVGTILGLALALGGAVLLYAVPPRFPTPPPIGAARAPDEKEFTGTVGGPPDDSDRIAVGSAKQVSP